MILYFEFEGKRRKAEVTWPKNRESIVVQLTDADLAKKLPADLLFDVTDANIVSFVIEDPANKRLIQLQNILGKRLQEFVNT